MPDFCAPDERDLRYASTGSNFNPRNILYIHPKGIYYAAPVVEIFAFLELEHKLPFFKGLVAGHGLIRLSAGPNQMKKSSFMLPHVENKRFRGPT